ncbi:MAG: S8 family serine peptidase [Deltaproteobacteria bacterium]|nr:S8 family serine peptidase [Deltaproteobacteria bacterium]
MPSRRSASFVFSFALRAAVLALGASLTGCSGEVVEAPTPESAPAEALAKLSPTVRQRLESGSMTDALVVLDGETIEARAREARGLGVAPSERCFREERRAVRELALREAKATLDARVPTDGVEVLREYDQLPVRYVNLSSLDAALALAGSSDVVSLHENLAHEAFAGENLAIIEQPAALQLGVTGAGATVAVLDTGLDYSRADFGGCTTPGEGPDCKVLHVVDLAPQDGALDDAALPHGTAVAATIAAVAPSVKLVGLDVFSGGLAYDVDVVEGLNWVIENRAAYGIEAINMSLGGGKYTAACSGFATAEAIKAARDVGILTAVASGNNSYAGAIAYPACAPAAVSVGATTASAQTLNGTAVLADTVTYYSNASAQLKMLAPGSVVTALGSGWHGTSFASPHVAAAVASLSAAYPQDTPDELESRLLTTGKSIYDGRVKRNYPRLDFDGAAATCVTAVTPTSVTIVPEGGVTTFSLTTSSACAWTATTAATYLGLSAASGSGSAALTVTVPKNDTTAARTTTITFAGKALTVTQSKDTTAPKGTVLVNAGAAATTDATVTLAITGTDLNEVKQMCVSNATTCSAWEAFATTRSWKLSAGDGAKTVRVWLKDGVGNATSAPPADGITLDTTGPTGGTIKAMQLDGALALTWSGMKDAHSGVASYLVAYAPGTTAPATCSAGALVYSGTELTYAHAGLVNGTVHSYRVCGVDGLGKVGTGIVVTGKPIPYTAPPVGSVVVNAGAVYTKTQAVSLAIQATSQGTVTEMCVSNGTTCSTWMPYATTLAWTLSATNGTKTVRVWLRDEWGNATATPVLDSIVWDNNPPGLGTLTLKATAGTLTATWSGMSDYTSGTASYVVVMAQATTAPACDAGTVVYSGTATSYAATGLTASTAYAVRVCALDKAGNLSAGNLKTATTPL